MPDTSFANPHATGQRPRLGALTLPPGQRLIMLCCNYWALVHAVTVVLTGVLPWHTLWVRWTVAVLVLYGLPPALARGCRPRRLPQGEIDVGSSAFLRWWALSCLQVLFCRLPFLEEVLRLIPGCYSMWLRLWGAQIGRLTYWAAGVMILDRSFVRIGDDVLFGAGVRLTPHVLSPNTTGDMVLWLGDVDIGHQCMVGGYALLTAGTRIDAAELVPACQILPPFSRWRNGRRLKGEPTRDATPNGDET